MSRCISYFRGMALVSLNILSWKEEICALKPPEQSFQVNTWRLPLTMMSIFTIHKTFCVQEISRTKVEEGVHNVGLCLQGASKSSSTKAVFTPKLVQSTVCTFNYSRRLLLYEYLYPCTLLYMIIAIHTELFSKYLIRWCVPSILHNIKNYLCSLSAWGPPGHNFFIKGFEKYTKEK